MTEISAVITSLRNRARKLEEFAAELERLAVSENLVVHLPDNSQPESKRVSVPEEDAPPRIVKLAEKKKKTSRVLTCRGLRAGVLRYLYTGEASAAAISHAIGIDFSKVKGVCTQLVHDNFATAEQRTTNVINGRVHTMTVYVLTTIGRDEAKFFVDNPNIMIRNKQSVSNAARRTRSATETRPN